MQNYQVHLIALKGNYRTKIRIEEERKKNGGRDTRTDVEKLVAHLIDIGCNVIC